MAETAQLGSFGNVSPEGMAAIRNAISRRESGGQVAALDQQSGVSPTASPLPAEPSGGVGTGAAGATPQATPLPELTGPELSPENKEAKIIVSALKERLNAISTIEGGVPPKGV